jgi:hypothetical protein
MPIVIDPSRVQDGRDHGARVHYRPKEGWIPTTAVVVREDAPGSTSSKRFVVRLREHTDHIGDEGELKTVREEDLASAFDVGEDVVVFGDDGKVRRGTVRSVDTTVWPPLFVIREDDDARTTFKVVGERCASAAKYDAERRRLENDAAKAVADAAADALMEEERREREEREKAAASKAAKAARKKSKKTDGSVNDGEDAEEGDEAEKAAEEARQVAAEEAEKARVAEEKAAAKAAARARQEEVKAEKAAREKAAKKEAQKARKAAERAKREAEEAAAAAAAAAAKPKEAREDAGVSEEVELGGADVVDDVRAGESVVAEIAEEIEPKSASNVETDAPVSAPKAEEQPTKPLTETQRRKLEKERRKAQRMAEIDAFLKAHDVAIDADDDVGNNGGKTTSEAAGGKSKRNKKKNKKKPVSAGSHLANAPLAAKPASGDWFAAFAVLSFFIIASVVYYSYDFIRRKFLAVAFT